MLHRYLARALAPAALALALAACGATTTSAPAPAMADQPTAAAMMEAQPTAAAMTGDHAMADAQPTAAAMTGDHAMADAQPTAAAMMGDHAMADAQPTAAAMMGDHATNDGATMSEAPAWQQVTLTDARSGASFTLADFAGKTVYVEPMATWCSNCRRQLGNVREAQARLGDDVVFIGLSVETTISPADLAGYADAQGFDWTFAVATPELLQQLTDTFGRTVTNPPSTPHFIIGPDGSAGDLLTGYSTPDEIVALVQ